MKAGVAAFAGIAVVLSLGLASHAAASGRRPAGNAGAAVNVSQTSTDSLTPVIATSGETVHVAWIESESTTDGLRATIWYARSSDSGVSFEPSRPVAPLTGYASALQCVVDGAVVHLAWLATSYTTGSPAAVDYQRSEDGGTTFEPFVALNGPGAPGAPALAVTEGRVAVIWQAENRIWMARSTDGGAAFEPAASVGEFPTIRATTVRAASMADGLLLAWISPTDEGGATLGVGRVSWETGMLVGSEALETRPVAEVTAVASGSDVLISWITVGSVRSVLAARSVDGGVTFPTTHELGLASTFGGLRAACSAGTAYVTWIDSRGRLSVSRIESEGRVQAILIRSSKRALFPDVFVFEGIATVVWRAGSGTMSLVRGCFVDSTGNASAVFTVAKRGRSAAAPRISTGGAQPIVAWQQHVDGTADVFVRKLSDQRQFGE